MNDEHYGDEGEFILTYDNEYPKFAVGQLVIVKRDYTMGKQYLWYRKHMGKEYCVQENKGKIYKLRNCTDDQGYQLVWAEEWLIPKTQGGRNIYIAFEDTPIQFQPTNENVGQTSNNILNIEITSEEFEELFNGEL